MWSAIVRHHREVTFCFVILLLSLIFVVFMFMLTPFHLGYWPRRSTTYDFVRRDLKVIGVALRTYEAVYDQLPQAVHIDPESSVTHSWRISLLPRVLYAWTDDENSFRYVNDYDWSKPWNAPENRSITQREMDCYRSPRYPKDRPRTASYLAVVDEGFVFDPVKAVTTEDIKDGPSKTIMLVEVVDSDIEWAEPRDLNFAGFLEYLNRLPDENPGFLALMADGSVNYFKKSDFNKEQLHGLFTINGGEKIDW